MQFLGIFVHYKAEQDDIHTLFDGPCDGVDDIIFFADTIPVQNC
jgi:hypothetical protein